MTEISVSAQAVLKAHPLGRFLDSRAQAAINQNLKPVHFEPGTHMLQEGERPESLYLIHRGCVEVHKEVATNTRQLLTTLQSPLLLGEISFLLQQPCSATVIAQDAVEGWELRREALQAMLRAQEPATSGLLFYLGATLAERLRTMNEMVMKLKDDSPSLGDLEGFVEKWHGEFMMTEELEPAGWELGAEIEI